MRSANNSPTNRRVISVASREHRNVPVIQNKMARSLSQCELAKVGKRYIQKLLNENLVLRNRTDCTYIPIVSSQNTTINECSPNATTVINSNRTSTSTGFPKKVTIFEALAAKSKFIAKDGMYSADTSRELMQLIPMSSARNVSLSKI